MAATPSKPPSEKSAIEAMDALPHASSSRKDPPSSSTADASTKPPPMPTYEDSETSEYYKLAKDLLNKGEFEESLTTIEQGIEATKTILQHAPYSLDEEAISIHESMAPYNYLYGTTLLYSIEESSGGQDMTLGAGNNAEGGQEGGGDEEEGGEPPADDMEIAWETLDASRAVMETLLTHQPTNHKLKLALAQVHLREGDLQRLNGRYENATRDYSTSLSYLEGNPLLGPFDRKFADAHHQLGRTYTLQVTDPKSQDQGEEQGGVQPAKVAEDDDAKLEQKRAFWRGRSLHHYLQSGRIFCAQAATLCNVDPATFLAQADASLPNFKTTGEDKQEAGDGQLAGIQLKQLRKHVSELTPPAEFEQEFEDLFQILEEIQETIDEAMNSEQGVHEVTGMKAEISAAVAAQADQNEADASGEGATVATTTTGFGSAAAASSTAAAQPLTMMVKKKKKREAPEDQKEAADPSKRPKSE